MTAQRINPRFFPRAGQRRSFACFAIAAVAIAGALQTQAQPSEAAPVPVIHATVNLEKDALSNAQGGVQLNMTGGDNNLQQNNGALALGHRGAVNAHTQGQQHTGNAIPSGRYHSDVAISTGALNHSRGLISVNQSGGHNNAQSNSIAIALGVDGISEVVADNELAATASGGNLADRADTTGSGNSTTVSGDAMVGVSGVGQVNQVAGSGNVTANRFALSVELGANNR